MEDVKKIDKRMSADTTVSDGILFRNVLEKPFEIYGLMQNDETGFCRLPLDVAKEVSNGVYGLAPNTAGGRVRFSTDSDVVTLKIELYGLTKFDHMAAIGVHGFDLFEDDGGEGIFVGSFRVPHIEDNKYTSSISLKTRKMRNLTINFPLYNGVKSLEIGLREDASLGEGEKYRDMKPIIYYGSSITQGGCACRPGNSYQSIIARKNHIDYVNLGFSGSAKGEQRMAEYIAGLDMSLFFYDYDHNAPDAQYLKATHYDFYETIRKSNPDLPIVMVSAVNKMHDIPERKAVIYSSYEKALKNGDKNVYFIDGQEAFGDADRDCCTVDNCHPNDLGFQRMAALFGKNIDRILG